MATSGPITYLVMADQFLSVAARLKRLPQTTATSSPLIGMGGPLAGVSVLGEFHRRCIGTGLPGASACSTSWSASSSPAGNFLHAGARAVTRDQFGRSLRQVATPLVAQRQLAQPGGCGRAPAAYVRLVMKRSGRRCPSRLACLLPTEGYGPVSTFPPVADYAFLSNCEQSCLV